MHDCPITLGLECIHFTPLEEEPEVIDAVAHTDLHERLMEDYLSRSYFHRIRSLSPAGDGWHERQDELADRYAAVEPEPDDAPDDVSEEFEAERARLLAIRRKREEQRREREELERAAKQRRTRERAERALREAEARTAKRAEGPRRRTRRRGGKENAAAPAAKPEQAATETPRKKRRRRRRRRRKGGDGASSG